MDLPAVLAEIEADLALVKTWTDVPDAALAERKAQAWRGAGARWLFLVVAWSLGYDGTATALERPTVVHLTPKLARAAVRAARGGKT